MDDDEEVQGEEEEMDETGIDSQVHMACVMQGRRVGVAYYDSSTRQLFVLEIWEDSSGGFPLIDLVKCQAKPSTIYASTKTEEELLSALQRNDSNDEAPVVKLMKSSTFSYEQAWHRLIYLKVAAMDDGLSVKERICFVLLSTHLTEIFTENYLPQINIFFFLKLPQSEHIKCYTMSVLNPDGQTSNEDIIFLYRLVPGQALLSFGLHCAQLAGVPNEVVQRAASVLEDIYSKRPIRRMICDKLVAKDQQYQDAMAKLLAFDTRNGDLNNFFEEMFPPEP